MPPELPDSDPISRVPHEILLVNGESIPCHCWYQGTYHTMTAMELHRS
jgi:hypothetical protein